MIRASKLAVLLLFCVTTVSCQKNQTDQSPSAATQQKKPGRYDFSQNVIYGEDDRLEYYQITNPQIVALIDATAVLVNKGDVASNSSTTSVLIGDLLKDVQPGPTIQTVCKDEPFSNQATPGFCSGSLVAEDIIMTAGHCMAKTGACSKTKFIFGFAQHSATEDATIVNNTEIYSCKEVLSQSARPLDYALVRLDRKVANHQPVKLRSSAADIKVGESIFVVGYPSGLPVKIAGGSRVRAYEPPNYFRANLDTYGGNSGSAVFNETTGEVEGILVEGEKDWKLEGDCYVSNRCADADCRGESVTMANRVKPLLDRILAGGSANESPTPQPTAQATPTPTPTETPFPQPESIYVSNDNMAIPDFDAGSLGLLSSLNAQTAPNGRKVYVRVNIKHPYRGDLSVKLTAPNRKSVVLFFRDGGSAQDLVGTFGEDLTSLDDLSVLSSVTTPGTWLLHIEDIASEQSGTLVEWALIFK